MKVALVSKLTPETNYSAYLAEALENKVTLSTYETLWQALKIIRDRPDIAHFQHEFTMYGGKFSIVVFPFVLMLIKFVRIKTIVTIHAVVARKDINDRFAYLFEYPVSLIWFIRLGLSFIYWTIVKTADVVIIHANISKNILINDYGAREEKIEVIPHGVPD